MEQVGSEAAVQQRVWNYAGLVPFKTLARIKENLSTVWS